MRALVVGYITRVQAHAVALVCILEGKNWDRALLDREGLVFGCVEVRNVGAAVTALKY